MRKLILSVAPLYDFNLSSTAPVPSNFCQNCHLHASINSFCHQTNCPPPLTHWHWCLPTLWNYHLSHYKCLTGYFQLKYLYVISLEHHIYCDGHGSPVGVVSGLAFFKNALVVFSGINHISLHLWIFHSCYYSATNHSCDSVPL